MASAARFSASTAEQLALHAGQLVEQRADFGFEVERSVGEGVSRVVVTVRVQGSEVQGSEDQPAGLRSGVP